MDETAPCELFGGDESLDLGEDSDLVIMRADEWALFAG